MKLFLPTHPHPRFLLQPSWFLWLAFLAGAMTMAGCNLSQRVQPTPTLNLTEIYGTLSAMVTAQPTPTPGTALVGATVTPALPTLPLVRASSTPGSFLTSSSTLSIQPALCDQAAPGAPIDVTIPDNTVLEPGEVFTKIWRLENSGTCSWTVGYSAAFFYGDRMDAPAVVPLSQVVPPGGTAEIAVEMVAPLTPGTYQGNWKLSNADGILFGIGPNGDAPFWVRIIVSAILPGTPSPTPTLTLLPVNTSTPTPSPTITPPVQASGVVILLPLDLIDLDTLDVVALGADLEYQTGANNYHWLIPTQSVLLGVFGSLEPDLDDCQGATMSSAPIAVESLSLGTYLCYRTDQGAAGRALLVALAPNTYALTLDLLTWVQP